jgi:hypothetical protein
MREPSRLAFQIRHYRDLAQIAADCAYRNAAHRSEYLELARQWTVLADQLEAEEQKGAGPGGRKNSAA